MSALFHKHSACQAYAKIGLMGSAGSGKTRTATEIAIGLHQVLKEGGHPGGDSGIYFLDTETGSDWVSPIYNRAGIELNVAQTRAFSDLVPAIKEAEKHNAILIVDSITHFWKELTESYTKKKKRWNGLQFQDWAFLKRQWGHFADTFVNSKCHILICGRLGFDYDYEENDSGKKELIKTGVKMKAEGETGYEPNLLLYLERHQELGKSGEPVRAWRTATVLKDRSDLLDGKVFVNPKYEHFSEHIEFLRLGGEHKPLDTSRNSEQLIDEEAGDEGRNERQQYAVEKKAVLDEIKQMLQKYYPSRDSESTKSKADLLENSFFTRSWVRLETYSLDELKKGFGLLVEALEGSDADEGGEQ